MTQYFISRTFIKTAIIFVISTEIYVPITSAVGVSKEVRNFDTTSHTHSRPAVNCVCVQNTAVTLTGHQDNWGGGAHIISSKQDGKYIHQTYTHH